MTVDKITAVILCGGVGSRLKPVLPDIPKPMASIGETPFLQSVVDFLRGQGIRRIILCIGFKGEVIKKYFEGFTENIELIFSEESTPLGTAGAIKNAEAGLQLFPVLVLNGDTHYSVDIHKLLEFHEKRKGIATMVVTKAGKRQDGGSLRVNQHARVLSFEEKPSNGQISYLSAGMYLFEREVLKGIPWGPSSLEKEIIPGLLNRNVFAFSVDVPQFDIGTPERLSLFRNMHLATSTK
jgi:NDP-sugar pyrophosphorylase family protein